MWDRKELKAKAKQAFKANYWKSVIVAIVLIIAGGGAGFVSYKSGSNSASTQELKESLAALSQEELIAIALAILAGIAVICLVMFVVKVLLLNPLMVGCQKFFRENAEAPAEFDNMAKGFKTNYGRVVLAMLLQDIFLALWSVLFIIPGIVKTYSYRMVPFIVADNPEMSALDAITASRNMMRGHKFKAFVLDLSFIGWLILSACTLEILGVFYVNPYVFQTNAELYLALKDN